VSRASDDTREHTVGALREGLLQGRLGTDTFVRRVDTAYRAKTHAQLADVTRDLPRPAIRLRELIGRLLNGPRPRTLHAPHLEVGERRVLGRASSCDYLVGDPTVSNRHAELIRLDEDWLIRDLGSRNGTRVNGWLVTEHRLRNGDTLTLGGSVFVFDPD
jgi:pSer/pThr/pTyr-binding forkhead associated (FHA) protein